jgi:hypothetical protein
VESEGGGRTKEADKKKQKQAQTMAETIIVRGGRAVYALVHPPGTVYLLARFYMHARDSDNSLTCMLSFSNLTSYQLTSRQAESAAATLNTHTNTREHTNSRQAVS